MPGRGEVVLATAQEISPVVSGYILTMMQAYLRSYYRIHFLVAVRVQRQVPAQRCSSACIW